MAAFVTHSVTAPTPTSMWQWLRELARDQNGVAIYAEWVDYQPDIRERITAAYIASSSNVNYKQPFYDRHGHQQKTDVRIDLLTMTQTSNGKTRLIRCIEGCDFHITRQDGSTSPEEDDVRANLKARTGRYDLQLAKGELKQVMDFPQAPTLVHTCCACQMREVNIQLFPCRHACTCGECTEQIKNGTGLCPICRTPIKDQRTIVDGKVEGKPVTFNV